MSEKKQLNAVATREKMSHRYSDGHNHKHDKSHNPYRQHARSHPAQPHKSIDETKEVDQPTGLLRAFKLRKIRKRLDKGRFH